MEELKYYLRNGFIYEKLVNGPIAKARSLEKAELIVNALNNSPAVSGPRVDKICRIIEDLRLEVIACSDSRDQNYIDDLFKKAINDCKQAWQDAQGKQ